MTETTLISSKVFVTGVKVQAEIGVYRHEIGRVQPLIVDVELDVPTDASDRLADTFNYEAILQAAQEVAAGGHIHLVETFAHRLAAEFGAPTEVSIAGYQAMRITDAQSAPELRAIGGIRILERSDGALVALFESRYRLQRLEADKPELTLEAILADTDSR